MGDDKTIKSLISIVFMFSCVRLFSTSWNAVHQAILSMGFFRQEYWSGRKNKGDPCVPTCTHTHTHTHEAPIENQYGIDGSPE